MLEVLLQFVLLVVGFAMLIKGADWFVEGASKIADRFGIPQLVIGLTIVAMGTSAPEAAISINSALKENAGITIGNVLGSNIMNVLVILGVTSVIHAIAVQKSTIKYEIPFMIGISVFLAAVGLWDNEISRLEGGILCGFMVVYLVYLLRMAKSSQDSGEEGKENGKEKKLWILLILVLVGAGLIVFGSDVTVNAATAIAKVFHMDDRLIGLTIVAFGTSLPELVTSVTAAMKGKEDIAIGNIVGSNIFNILFVVGITALIKPVVYSSDFAVDSIVTVVTGVLLWLLLLKSKKLGRMGGAVMLVGYMGYFVYLITNR